ncbi:MAG: tRNA preQ1(34) S-adenosylmethionine ribosyltransferase-isomerase QueA [Granulosicoccus sp.]|nr:tRNA preQ1(34) S-adenosylmethionine ribosyltransferase-isomerase QueA [Granulosicoccus sp.]
MSPAQNFHYDLPDELIAQAPLANRSDSRLLMLQDQQLSHHKFRDLPVLLEPGDRLVFNNTRVIPARLFGQKASGGKIELMLERFTDGETILASVRSSRAPRTGSTIILYGTNKDSVQLEVLGRQDQLFELKALPGASADLSSFIHRYGAVPLPPYIKRQPDNADAERYQTVFAESPGAVAAPTAGLHFDQILLDELTRAGIAHSFITLHVGTGTFQPVRVENPCEHVMHAERFEVSQETVDQIAQTQARGGRVIAVGTTCVRSLEAAAASGRLQSHHGETRLFITPGFKFRVIDGMVTNFHLPDSTLMMLVAAFAGLKNIKKAYQLAVDERYRFFSYGDAMLLWPAK